MVVVSVALFYYEEELQLAPVGPSVWHCSLTVPKHTGCLLCLPNDVLEVDTLEEILKITN